MSYILCHEQYKEYCIYLDSHYEFYLWTLLEKTIRFIVVCRFYELYGSNLRVLKGRCWSWLLLVGIFLLVHDLLLHRHSVSRLSYLISNLCILFPIYVSKIPFYKSTQSRHKVLRDMVMRFRRRSSLQRQIKTNIFIVWPMDSILRRYLNSTYDRVQFTLHIKKTGSFHYDYKNTNRHRKSQIISQQQISP